MKTVDKLIRELAREAVNDRASDYEGSERYWEDKEDELRGELEETIAETFNRDLRDVGPLVDRDERQAA